MRNNTLRSQASFTWLMRKRTILSKQNKELTELWGRDCFELPLCTCLGSWYQASSSVVSPTWHMTHPYPCHPRAGSRVTIEFQLRLGDLFILCKGTISLHVERLYVLPEWLLWGGSQLFVMFLVYLGVRDTKTNVTLRIKRNLLWDTIPSKRKLRGLCNMKGPDTSWYHIIEASKKPPRVG